MNSITDAEIAFVESILLSENEKFDDERRAFIKNLTTIDLQAVPGSGKTTALLAKLLILSNRLPFDDKRGILVLSHTNAAVDEIKDKILMHCPKLFSFPCFVGTIQSFVDTFLAVPGFVDIYGFKPHVIDDDVYRRSHYPMPYSCRGYFGNRPFSKESQFYGSRLLNDSTLINKDGSGFGIRSGGKVYNELLELKKSIREKGILCYDEAYLFAELYLNKYPRVKNFLRKRFSFVFVDEMQDMSERQYNLIDKIFVDPEESCVIQRIGDKNQAIYSEGSSFSSVWVDRDKVLSL
jgi:DNA helicase-2/ATP-dependent DNA helicase PcrA